MGRAYVLFWLKEILRPISTECGKIPRLILSLGAYGVTFCPVPDFDENGLLPKGIYDCDLKVLECRFVESFPSSSTRLTVYKCFVQWWMVANMIVPAATEWIDGSYVTAKVDPRDIDIVTFCDAEFLNSLSGNDEITAEFHLNKGPEHIDAYLIGVYPKEAPEYPLYQAELRQIGKWGFGRFWKKTGNEAYRTDQPKGFLRMILNNKTEAPNVDVD